MKANELRIGNYVLPYGFNEDLCYSVIEISSGYITILINKDAICNASDQFKPIPLTEQWLLDFGFYKANDLDMFYYLDILNDWTKIYFNPKFGVCELSISSHGAVIKIKHVHQLQNLYFALTGNELNKS